MPLPPPILPPPTLQSLPNLSSQSNEAESYENLQFQSLTDPTSNKVPVYAISTKKKNSAPIAMEEEEAPVYENYDFQEDAIYQNMMVSPKGRMIPAKNVKSNDVYAQVKFLRMSVQEVNAIIEEEVPNLSKRSELVMQRAKQLDDQCKTSHFSRTASTGSVKRSSNFKNILYKFNVMSQSQQLCV
jgi:hypothetical protein